MSQDAPPLPQFANTSGYCCTRAAQMGLDPKRARGGTPQSSAKNADDAAHTAVSVWPTSTCCIGCALECVEGLPSGLSVTQGFAVLKSLEKLGAECVAALFAGFGLPRALAITGLRDYLASLADTPHGLYVEVR